jgi:hypothetical protein
MGGTMVDWQHIAWVLVWCAVLALLIALAVYLLGRFRGNADEDQPPASDLLTKFREMHTHGGLSDEEFRTIKTLLAQRLQDELRSRNKSGGDSPTSAESSAGNGAFPFSQPDLWRSEGDVSDKG